MFRILSFIFILMIFSVNAAQNKPQNIVFILADDLGWNDTNIFQQSQFLETPNIDSLAAKGMVFSHAYTNSPLCSPTRASILTGQTPARHGSTTPNHHLPTVNLQAYLPASGPSNKKSIAPKTVTRLDTKLPTLSSILKANNYQTAHFGKWHLGASPYSPIEHGFDLDIPHYAGPGPNGGFLAPWSFAPDLQPQVVGEHIDIRLAQEAKEWVLDVKDDGPFFLNFWAFSVHAPFNADKTLVDYFTTKRSAFHSQRSATYAAMVKQFDDAVGILWDALVEAKVEDNTIIIFTSDNGGNMYNVLGEIHATSNFPLRGGKATNYDGGIRVPTAIIWPGLTQPNTLSNSVIQSVDFFPTLLNAMSLSWPATHIVDGTDIRPILQGQTIDERAVFTFYPAEPRVPDWLPPTATVTKGGWKLIRTFHYGKNGGHLNQLFDLNTDPSELINLVDSYVDIVDELANLLDDYLVTSNAVVPIINPNYRQGTFNYKSIGLPRESFVLPEERTQENLGFSVNTDRKIVKVGESVNITFELANESNATIVKYRQFMGPNVDLKQNGNIISFVAPEVFTAEYLSFAFIVQDESRIIRRQIAVQIEPSAVAPNLLITLSSQNVTKGGIATFNIEASDANKDFISMSVQSDNLATRLLSKPPTIGSYNVNIPADFSGSSITLVFSADDGYQKIDQSITFNVSESMPIQQDNNTTTSGGGTVGLISLVLIALCIIRRKVKGNEISSPDCFSTFNL
jgi:arylsulfatase A-like enzyme